MRLVTTTGDHEKIRWSKELKYSCEESLSMIKNAGFDGVDMNYPSYGHGYGDRPLMHDDWEDWCYRQRDHAAEIGLPMLQSHAIYQGVEADGKMSDWNAEMMRRSLRAAEIMNIPVMVFHPYTLSTHRGLNSVRSREISLELFRQYGEVCAKIGTKIAIENMARGPFACVDDLMELVETLNDPIFGTCWDFGHANIAGTDQCASLQAMGKKLYALHVHDNFGEKDDHTMPFLGYIPWEDVMHTLKEIGYEGEFTYEMLRFYVGLPDALKADAMNFAEKTGRYLIQEYDAWNP